MNMHVTWIRVHVYAMRMLFVFHYILYIYTQPDDCRTDSKILHTLKSTYNIIVKQIPIKSRLYFFINDDYSDKNFIISSVSEFNRFI